MHHAKHPLARRILLVAIAVAAPLVVATNGCGSVTGPTGGSGGHATSSSVSTGSPDAAPDHEADAPMDALGCGSQTCGPNQICVHPCCGGPALACVALEDGGACPPGYHDVPSCMGFPGPACQPDPCTPPPPFCTDVPTGCPSPVTCGCLPPNLCNGGCGFVSGRDVTCLCA